MSDTHQRPHDHAPRPDQDGPGSLTTGAVARSIRRLARRVRWRLKLQAALERGILGAALAARDLSRTLSDPRLVLLAGGLREIVPAMPQGDPSMVVVADSSSGLCHRSREPLKLCRRPTLCPISWTKKSRKMKCATSAGSRSRPSSHTLRATS